MEKISTIGIIGVIGLGLIGGSVAKAAKKQGWRVVANDTDDETLRAAKSAGAVDEAAAIADCARADVVVIAAPVLAAENIFAALAPALGGQTVITDTGSCKAHIVAAAKNILLQKSGRFVAAHPIAGREKSGFAAASADLFFGRPLLLCEGGAEADAFNTVQNFWQTLGAKTATMDAALHDEIFARVSHLPHILSYALVSAVAADPQSEELLPHTGGGFQDFIRIAGSHPAMWRDVCLANKTPIARALAAYKKQLATLEEHINNEDGDALYAVFDACRKVREARLVQNNSNNGEKQ